MYPAGILWSMIMASLIFMSLAVLLSTSVAIFKNFTSRFGLTYGRVATISTTCIQVYFLGEMRLLWAAISTAKPTVLTSQHRPGIKWYDSKTITITYSTINFLACVIILAAAAIKVAEYLGFKRLPVKNSKVRQASLHRKKRRASHARARWSRNRSSSGESHILGQDPADLRNQKTRAQQNKKAQIEPYILPKELKISKSSKANHSRVHTAPVVSLDSLSPVKDKPQGHHRRSTHPAIPKQSYHEERAALGRTTATRMRTASIFGRFHTSEQTQLAAEVAQLLEDSKALRNVSRESAGCDTVGIWPTFKHKSLVPPPLALKSSLASVSGLDDADDVFKTTTSANIASPGTLISNVTPWFVPRELHMPGYGVTSPFEPDHPARIQAKLPRDMELERRCSYTVKDQ